MAGTNWDTGLEQHSPWHWRLCGHTSCVAPCWCSSLAQLPLRGMRVWCWHVHSAPCPGCLSQNVQNTSLLPQGTSPPKPPRAHELRLLVRNIEVKLSDLRAAGNAAQLLLLPFGFGVFFLSFQVRSCGSSRWTACSQKKV